VKDDPHRSPFMRTVTVDNSLPIDRQRSICG